MRTHFGSSLIYYGPNVCSRGWLRIFLWYNQLKKVEATLTQVFNRMKNNFYRWLCVRCQARKFILEHPLCWEECSSKLTLAVWFLRGKVFSFAMNNWFSATAALFYYEFGKLRRKTLAKWFSNLHCQPGIHSKVQLDKSSASFQIQSRKQQKLKLTKRQKLPTS